LEALAFEEIASYRRAFAANSVFWVNDIDKKFYADGAYAYTVDPADPGSYWYAMTLNETAAYNFNINYNEDLRKTNLWINAPVVEQGKALGIAGTGVDLSAFIDSLYREYTGGGSLYFFNDAGEITGAQDSSLAAQKKNIAAELGKTGAEIFSRAEKLAPGGSVSFISPLGASAVGEVPALGWYIAVVSPLTIADYLYTPMTFIFLAMIAVIIFIFIVFNSFVSRILRPMRGMVDALDQISADWDMTRRLDVRRQDEIGALAGFFNRTFERIMELLKRIREQGGSLSSTGDELNAYMRETAAALDEIGGYIQNTKKQVTAQAGEVGAAVDSIEQIIAGLDNLNGHIGTQAGQVAQSSAAIEQMLANIRSVTGTLVRNMENINALTESSETGRTGLEAVSRDIQEIARESEGLLEINSVMQNIASQTNLLSMNAAIEAAHAGDAGKGFAVVADEIRKLAENSGAQSKTISAVLKKIKVSIDTITASTAAVLEQFETIAREVSAVSNQETQIREAMEEQGIGSQHILEAVTQLNAVTGLVQSASAVMAEESRSVIGQSRNLRQITGGVAESMDEMARSADQISAVVERVGAMSRKNKQNIGALNQAISLFKVE
ncbi:MAG: methyl-accepting chemotaxis protein, partial [Treponema sp.]|nr:methyl-accepting chemotaxis protein [Treponema sp.]